MGAARTIPISRRNSGRFSFVTQPFHASRLSFQMNNPVSHFSMCTNGQCRRNDVVTRVSPHSFHVHGRHTRTVCRRTGTRFRHVRGLCNGKGISTDACRGTGTSCVATGAAFGATSCRLRSAHLVTPFGNCINRMCVRGFRSIGTARPVVSFVSVSRLGLRVCIARSVTHTTRTLSAVRMQFSTRPSGMCGTGVVRVSGKAAHGGLSCLLATLLPGGRKGLLTNVSNGTDLGTPSISALSRKTTVPRATLYRHPARKSCL